MTAIKTGTQYNTEVKEPHSISGGRGGVACMAKTVVEQVGIVKYYLYVSKILQFNVKIYTVLN